MELSNDKENNAKQLLESYVKDYKIFIDTCSLMDDAADKFWDNITPILKRNKKKVIIPLRCIEELEKHQKDKTDKEKAKKAKKAYKKIIELQEAKYISIKGESNDNFADNVFLVVFTKFRLKYNLLLITQDKNLSEDILSLNDTLSASGKNIKVERINTYGFTSRFRRESDDKDETKNSKKTAKTKNLVDDSEKFRICQTVTSMQDTNNKITDIPSENETVYTDEGPIRLLDVLGRGGEGVIYQTNTPYVAKIYSAEKNTKLRYEKIKLLASKKLKCEGICFPTSVLYNSKKEFVGYLMPCAQGKELQRSVFIRPLFEKHFPNWRKKDTVQLSITILEKIKYLHDRNIILGDINPMNVLVKSATEVYFVDTDSYQVEDFPCPVGTIPFTAPELQKKGDYKSYLRTKGNENFAIATLLFEIMLPGKPPYAQQGGDNQRDNILKMDFSYPLGDSSNKKTPDGPWRFMWSHLTYKVKENFYFTFRKGEAYSKENSRLGVDDWLKIFKYYYYLLDSGKLGEQDKMSEEIFPNRFKKNPNSTYVFCKMCREEVDITKTKDGICFSCLNKKKQNITYTLCKICRNKVDAKYTKKGLCFSCLNETRITKTCCDCGMLFDITNGEYEYYAYKNLSLPKRCKDCRENKKYNNYNYVSPSYHNPSSNSYGGCFITTAVCDYLGKADDCYELDTLRQYRDKWLANQPDGKSLISEYYSRAPDIVEKLNASKYYNEYCEMILEKYINPCITLIEQNKYNECKNKYIEMVNYLDEELSK